MATRTLVLIRHAKAADGPVDIERSLTTRGRRDARAVSDWLAKLGVAPERVVVSPAARARQTWAEAAAALPGVGEPVVDDRIYDNALDVLLDIVHETPDDVRTLVLVGHNPSVGELAYRLDDGAGDRGNEMLGGFPTSAVAVFEVSVPWSDLAPQGATLRHCAAPRG
jgi:phosphohistidine phosphatase